MTVPYRRRGRRTCFLAVPPKHIEGFIIKGWTGEVGFRCDELRDTFGLIFFQQICVFISIDARREVSEELLFSSRLRALLAGFWQAKPWRIAIHSSNSSSEIMASTKKLSNGGDRDNHQPCPSVVALPQKGVQSSWD